LEQRQHHAALVTSLLFWGYDSDIQFDENMAEDSRMLLKYELLGLAVDYIASTFTGDKGEHRVGQRVSKVIIINKTQPDSKIEDDDGKPLSWKRVTKFLHKELPTLKRESLDSFREVNVHPVTLEHSFRLPVAYALVDKAEVDAVFRNGGWWTDYYKKYPDSQGILSLSRVGFSLDGTQAVFYASNGCGGKCGTGAYVVMEKIDSGWKVAKEVIVWTS
jgi:hypothetical protein